MEDLSRTYEVHTCRYCGRAVRGNSFFQHVRACERRPVGPTKQIYPVKIPEDLYNAFKSRCAKRDMTLAEGVWELIEEAVTDG